MKVFLCSILFSSIVIAQTDSCEEKYESWHRLNSAENEWLGSPLTHPKIKNIQTPIYTDSAKINKIEGTVIIWFLVDTLGNTKCHKVIQGLGFGLDESVLKAVQLSSFEPAILNSQRYEEVMVLPFKFKLNSSK